MKLAAEERALFVLARMPRPFDEAVSGLQSLLEECDPSRLAKIAADHLVHPLVAYNLKRSGVAFDETAAEFLERHFRASHRSGLLLGHALVELLSDFAAAGVGAVSFKGPVFATTCYGDVRLRAYGDLDLFVSVEDVRRARDLLLNLGFKQLDPLPEPLDVRVRSYWPFGFPHGNAVGFVRDGGKETQVDVDLQWAAAPNFLKVPINPADLMARRRTVRLFDRDLQTFDAVDTLVLMCLHGAKHAWTELRQVADVAACLEAAHRANDLNWEVVLERIAEAQLVRVCALAIRLAETLLGAPVPEEYRARLMNEAESDAMESLASRVVEWRFGRTRGESARGRRRMGAIRYHLASRDRAYHGLGSVFYHIRHALR